jgi:hypothetical protein
MSWNARGIQHCSGSRRWLVVGSRLGTDAVGSLGSMHIPATLDGNLEHRSLDHFPLRPDPLR